MQVDNLNISLGVTTKRAVESIDRLVKTLDTLKSVSSGGFSGLDKISAEIDKIGISINKIDGGKLANLTRTITELGGANREVSKELKDVRQKLKDLNQAYGKANKVQEQSTKSSGEFLKSITRIAKYRAIRTALKYIADGFKQGIKYLVAYDVMQNGTQAQSNQTMSGYLSSWTQLSSALGASLMPLLTTLQPVVEVLADGLILVAESFQIFFKVLQGEGTYLKVNRDYVKDYSRSLSELKREMLGIDELNVLGQVGMDYSKMYEETPIGDTEAILSSISSLGILGGALGVVIGKTGLLEKVFGKKNSTLETQNKLEGKSAEGLGEMAKKALGLLGPLGLLGGALGKLFGKGTNIPNGETTPTAPATVPLTAPGLTPISEKRFKRRYVTADSRDLSMFTPPVDVKNPVPVEIYNSGEIGQKAEEPNEYLENVGKAIVVAAGLAIAALIPVLAPEIAAALGSIGAGAGALGIAGAYASGGIVPTGQLFIANESGPELVGQVNGRTAVTNQSQFLQGIEYANREVINAIYASGNGIVEAINEKDTTPIVSIGDRDIYNSYMRGKNLVGKSLSRG